MEEGSWWPLVVATTETPLEGSRSQCRLAVEVCENRRSSIKGGKKEKADII